jgi:Mor family transcriptional regulator
MEWIKEILIEDLPESYRMISQVVGVENAIKLSECLGGLPLYFPKLETLIARKKEWYILKYFNGSNHRELARATGYSERWVYKILHTNREKRVTAQVKQKK